MANVAIIIGIIFVSLHLIYKVVDNYIDGIKNATVVRGEERDNITTFFYQGNGASRFQAVLYTGGRKVKPEGMKTEGASHDSAPLLLHNIYEYPEIPEVEHRMPRYILYICERLIISLRLWYLGYKHARGHHLNLAYMSVGGDPDIQHHQTYLRRLLSEPVVESGKKKVVLFGCSRGAATTLTSMATLDEDEKRKIALVIAEAPFDTFPSVVHESSYFPTRLVLWCFRTLGSYRDDQLSPLAAMDEFPLDVPVAFITSKRDTRVPPVCTHRLIERLKERGHTKVHHLELEQSSHPTFPIHNANDATRYNDFLDRLYDKYVV